jgi:hypothetical protein
LRGIISHNFFREEDVAKRAGAYRSEKRKKELKRQKKQEEKRLRRHGLTRPGGEAENPEELVQEVQGSEEEQEVQEEAGEEGQGEEQTA